MAKKKATKKTPKTPSKSRERAARPAADKPRPGDHTRQAGRRVIELVSEPMRQARLLIDEALEDPDYDRRASLARKALERWPHCVEAYLLLAEASDTRSEAQELYRKAVEVGERALGPEFFEKEAGNFWRIEETRPYMQARLGLAEMLWGVGHREEALGHLRALLRLNPHDNQGVRYSLARWLSCLDRNDELAELLARFDEPTANCAYAKALLAFRQSGDSEDARAALKHARAVNKHVPAFLIGKKPLPSAITPFYQPGSSDEAVLCAASWLTDWRSTPGAIAWLRSGEKGTGRRKKKDATPPAQGPLPLVKKRLERLPKTQETWQADFRCFGPRMEIAGELLRPWLGFVASLADGGVLGQALVTSPPTADQFWDLLADAMQKPVTGRPRRPRALEVGQDPMWSELAPHLDELGVKLATGKALDLVDHVLEHVSAGLAEDQPPGMLESKDIGLEEAGSFYRAAAAFYRRAPWRLLDSELPIRFECDLEGGGVPRYAVVMGRRGETFGLTLYDDLNLLLQLWEELLPDEENALRTEALTVLYDDAGGIPDADLDALETHRWELAGPDAYPTPFRKEPGMSMRPPSAGELALLEAALRAIPDFVLSRPYDDLTTYEATVTLASGAARVTLAWLDV